MNGHKCVALDIGGVCIDILPEKCLKRLGVSDWLAVPEEFLSAVDGIETGVMGHDEWLRVFHDVTGGVFSDSELIAAWNEVIGLERAGMVDLVRDYSARGVRFVYFSDTSPDHISYLNGFSEISGMVYDAVYSFEVGAKKPGSLMYEDFERRFGVPELYIDDKPENIAAGIRRGWNSRQYRAVSDAGEALAELFGQ